MNNFRKALAIVLALAMVFAFAACGSKDEPAPADETTTAAEVTDTEETTAAEAVSGEETSAEEASVEETTVAEEASAEETTVAEESSAADETTTEASKGLNSTNIAEVVAYYNAARANTKKAPKGHQTMKLDGDITGEGAMGALLKVLSPAAKSALEKNSNDTDYIPGNGELKVSDVSSAKATSKNGVTTIEIKLRDQTEGPSASGKDGPVGRGIGTLGNIEKALSELGAEISEGKDTVKLTYNNAYIKCTVDENTNTITGGTWHHTVNVLVGNAKAKISIVSANLKNLKAKVDYKVVI